MQKNIKIDNWNDFSINHLSYNCDTTELETQTLQNRIIGAHTFHLHKSLSDWINEVRQALREIYCKESKLQHADSIAEIFNQAIAIFIALENYNDARELCYTQIQAFIHWSKKIKIIEPLKHVFQPWMQLIQINRLEGNTYDAFKKLNILNFYKQKNYFMYENTLLTESLYQALYKDPILYHEIITQTILEKIHLSFQSGQYSELISFIEKNDNGWCETHIIREARAIAYANTGKYQKAFSVLNGVAYQNTMKNSVLKIREFELRLALGVNSLETNILESLYQSSMMLEVNHLKISNITMMLHLAWVMRMAGMIDKAVSLSNFCLELAIKIGDEVLKAESLIALYECGEDKKKIEDLMIKHFFNTRYASVRKKMIYCFKELKFVETKYHYDDARFLFEDLLALDMNYFINE